MCDRAVPIAPAPPIEIRGGACHVDQPAPTYEGGARGARLARRVNALAVVAASSRSPIVVDASAPSDTNAPPSLEGAADRLRAQGSIFDKPDERIKRRCARRPKATNRAAMQRESRRRNRGRR